MPYHQGLTRAQGDPGFFSFVGKALGGIAKTVGGIIPGPIGTIVSAAGTILAPPKATKKPPPPVAVPWFDPRGATATAQAAQRQGVPISTRVQQGAVTTTRGGVTLGLPAAAPAARPIPATIDPTTGLVCCKPRRRRIDPLNIKALRRANSRQKAFLRAVDTTLKGMPTRGSVSSRRKKISGAVRK